MTAVPHAANSIRPLNESDIERITAIDRVHSGRARRHFFEKRFAAASARPNDFLHLGVMRGGALRGFAFVQLLRGEFGRDQLVAVLDAVGVEPESQERGIGQALMEHLIERLRGMGAHSLQSQADWTNHSLLRFFDNAGFDLAPRFALERPVADPLAEPTDIV